MEVAPTLFEIVPTLLEIVAVLFEIPPTLFETCRFAFAQEIVLHCRVLSLASRFVENQDPI